MNDVITKNIKSKVRQVNLQASESRYRRLFETAKDGIIILDADTGRITDANPFLQDMLGYSHADLLGKALWEIGPVKDIAASQQAMRQLQKKEYVRYENLPLQTKAGDHIQVEFVSNVYLVDGWRVIQCNVRDITDRKRAEENLRTTNDELMASIAALQRRDDDMKSLIRLNELLQSCATQDEAYQVVSHLAGELFTGQSGDLAILAATDQHSDQDSDQHLDTVVSWGDQPASKSNFAAMDCWALRQGKLHEVGDDPRTDLMCQHFVQPPQGGYLCVPLIVQNGTIGLMSLVDTAAKNTASRAWQQLALAVGETIKLSLSNLKLRERLREEAIHDPLTGLYNRRYLDENLGRELHRAQRSKSPLCVALLDLDHFKLFNDTFGHDGGDLLLRGLARALDEKLRKSDISCRYGGDEFVVVMPDSSVADTQHRMEQICVLIKETQIRNGGTVLGPITVSAGVAGMPEHGSTAGELIQAADTAMYAAKQAGGGVAVVYQATES
jgi:diguanylate cyclase (GGDEF)-like protein/PAS domain S-box-containing protein